MEITLGELARQAADRYSQRAMSPTMLSGIWRGVEFLVLVSVSVAVIALYDLPAPDMFVFYVLVSICGALAGVSAIQTFGGYEVAMLRRGWQQFAPVAGGWAVALAMIALGFFFLRIQDELSRIWLVFWYAFGTAGLVAGRLLLARRVRRWTREGRMERRAVIVGGGQLAEDLIRSLALQPDNDVRICGIFDDRGSRRSPASIAGYPKLGNTRELVEFARRAEIDMLIVTIPLSAEARVLQLLRNLWVLPLDIRLCAPTFSRRLGDTSLSYVGQVPLLKVFDKPISGWNAILKRGFDLVAATVALALLLPVLLATAVAIKLDSRGPVIFRQKRHGFNNGVVDVLKFRSMYHEMADPTGLRIVTKNDARVTRVGRFIRKTSIDELPQLWNVIRGELSMVGPRPHAVHGRSSTNEAFIEIVDDYFGRHKVKPGITGWAQVNGYRGEIDHPEKLKKRIEHDLHYIENWSILLDIAILAKTPVSLLKTENAY